MFYFSISTILCKNTTSEQQLFRIDQRNVKLNSQNDSGRFFNRGLSLSAYCVRRSLINIYGDSN